MKHYWHLLAEFTNTCVWTTSLLLQNLAISVAQIKQLLWNVQLVRMLQQGALNVNLVPKELHVQPKDFLHMYYVQMELIQMLKVWVIVNSVQLASSVQVLEWKHQKNVLMEHTVTQLVLDIVFCVQRVIGKVNAIVNPCIYPCIDLVIHTYSWCNQHIQFTDATFSEQKTTIHLSLGDICQYVEFITPAPMHTTVLLISIILVGLCDKVVTFN